MTLLTTEIHNSMDPANTLIVFAADRRISRGSLYDSSQEKIFRIPGLNAGIGYFGLAEIPEGNERKPMAEWIRNFLAANSSYESLEQFAVTLMDSLIDAVPSEWQESEISGFHISGFNTEGLPEFWYVRNVDDDRTTLLGEYQVREDFQREHASILVSGAVQVYRNGDIRSHVVAWQKIDQSLGSLLNNSDFQQLTTPDEYVEWVKFKMEMIARFYEKFCKRSIIGRPVDAFVITDNSDKSGPQER